MTGSEVEQTTTRTLQRPPGSVRYLNTMLLSPLESELRILLPTAQSHTLTCSRKGARLPEKHSKTTRALRAEKIETRLPGTNRPMWKLVLRILMSLLWRLASPWPPLSSASALQGHPGPDMARDEHGGLHHEWVERRSVVRSTMPKRGRWGVSRDLVSRQR
jgi:hypothetical protein